MLVSEVKNSDLPGIKTSISIHFKINMLKSKKNQSQMIRPIFNNLM